MGMIPGFFNLIQQEQKVIDICTCLWIGDNFSGIQRSFRLTVVAKDIGPFLWRIDRRALLKSDRRGALDNAVGTAGETAYA